MREQRLSQHWRWAESRWPRLRLRLWRGGSLPVTTRTTGWTRSRASTEWYSDTTTLSGFRDALLWAGNYILANHNEYALEDKDLAVIVVARHISTSYGFNSAMWAKYGATLAGEPSGDAKSTEPPKANPTAATLATLTGQGVQFAVCSMATRRLAGMIARSTGGNTDAVFAELSANLIANARLVPAGIVAVNRAQERGYSLAAA